MPRWTRRPEGANWGDFGPDDQVGRMNLITPERRLAAFREVREGWVFCLSLPLDLPGGIGFTERRSGPRLSTPIREGYPNVNWRASLHNPRDRSVSNDDAVTLSTQYSTQWDALCHVGQEFDADGDGVEEVVYYNGFRAGEHILDADAGGPRALALGIENLAAAAVQGRGVLVDLYRLFGRERALVDYDQLMSALETQRVEVRTGDILCFYTGLCDVILEMGHDFDRDTAIGACCVLNGRDKRLLRWIEESGVAALASDNIAIEWSLKTLRDGERARMPLHELCLFKQGIHLGELWNFRELAAWLRERDRHAFLLTAPPLRLPGAAGSPVTPVATV